MSTDADADAGTAPRLSVGEQFTSFAAYAATTIHTPQPASTSLDVARYHAFTGEISFSTDPTVRLYLDGGVVYHAERTGDPTISQMLRDASVAAADQLERGMVRVGDVEHLGRLFDREPTIDRDAAMVLIETRTESIVRDLANRTVASLTLSPYRHHPSGVHRWFVGPSDATGSSRPVSAVAQVDRSVVDDLPTLAAPPMEIHWTQDTIVESTTDSASPDAAIQAELDRFDADRADWAAPGPDPSDEFTSFGDFQIVWPDGTADDAIVIAPHADELVPGTPDADSAGGLVPPPVDARRNDSSDALPAPIAAPFAAPDPVLVPPQVAPTNAFDAPEIEGEATPSFTLAPLQVDALPEPDAAVPDDVAAAVKRALQAIENASTGRATVPELAVEPIALPDFTTPVAPSGPTPAHPPAPVAAPVPDLAASALVAPPAVAQPIAPAPTGFAPPTADMRAEAVYERALAAARASGTQPPAPECRPDDVAVPVAQASPADDSSTTERRGALRRLIGSLRNKSD